MLLFTYDITMNPVEFAKRTGITSAIIVGVGYLPHYRLSFNRRSEIWHRQASLTESYGDKVYGVLFGIKSHGHEEVLQSLEYDCKRIPARVRLRNSHVIINAASYRTDDENIVDEDAVFPEYRDLLMKAALYYEMPIDYIDTLRKTHVIEGHGQ
jgi:hypothetical protein